MNDIHSEYLKDDHFEEDDEEELNLEPQKSKRATSQPSRMKASHPTRSWKMLSWSRC